MDKPKTLETLISETPEEVSASDVSDALGAKIADKEAPKAVQDERLGSDRNAEDSVRSGGEKSRGDMSVECCVDESQKEAKLESSPSGLRKDENCGEIGFLDSQSVGNEEALVEKIGEESRSDSNEKPNGVASNEGISLYVDICGSPDGLVKERGRIVDGSESSFAAGDIVWVQTKNRSWWPGKICDPIDAPSDLAKTGREGACLLVWCYGISHFAWCFPFQLRLFHESFVEMSSKNKARVFHGAVEKALDEFGRFVKSEMTCSCDPKGDRDSSDELVPNSEHISARLGGFSVTNFEPMPFLERVKYLAEVVSTPCKLDVTVTQCRLSAFYSSIGHRKLPMNLLAEKDDTEEEMMSQPKRNVDQVKDENMVPSSSRKRKPKKGSELEVDDTSDEAKDSFPGKDDMMEKGFDTRERKKSRYLSYPYVNFVKKGGIEEDGAEDSIVTQEASACVSQDIMSLGNSKGNSAKFWKKWYKGFSGSTSETQLNNAASAELLRELLSAAVEGLLPNQHSGFTPVGWFFSRFRISSYHDESADETYMKNMTGQHAATDAEACFTGNKTTESKAKHKGKKQKETSTADLQGEISLFSPNVEGADTLAGGEDLKGTLDSSLVKDELTGNKPSENKAKRKGKKQKETSTSDLLGEISLSSPNVVGSDASAGGKNKAKRKGKKQKETSTTDLQGEICLFSPNVEGADALAGGEDLKGTDSSLVKDELAGNKPSENKAKRKGKKQKETSTKDLKGEIPLSAPNVMGSDKAKRKRKKQKETLTTDLQGKISLSWPNVVGSDASAGGEDLKGTLDSSLVKDVLTAVKKSGPTESEALKMKPLSGLSDVNITVDCRKVTAKDALEMGQPLPCSNKAKKKKKKKSDGSNLQKLKIEQTADIPDLNGINDMPSLNDSQVANNVASESKPESQFNLDSNKGFPSGLTDACDKNTKPGNLVVDLRVPQVGSAGFSYVSHTAALMDFIGNSMKPGSVERDGQPFGMFAVEEDKPMPKKRKRKEKKAAPEQVPDLNGGSGEPNLAGNETQETNGTTPPVKPAKKKRKRMQVILNYPRNPSFATRPDTGSALLLTFRPGSAMPSNEDLVSTFSKFGQVKESETRVSGDTNSVQIAFVKSTDANEALKSVERNNPFGSTLVNFMLQPLSAPPRIPEPPQPVVAADAPPLDFIKQNLQMMTSRLEKSGDCLPQEIRTKLENEINGLLSKVSTMAGSCSSHQIN